MSEMAENTRNDPDFRVPAVDWDRTTHNVLTMEWIDGIALNDHTRLEQSQVDLPDLGRKVIQSFLRHALRDGFFHADMLPAICSSMIPAAWSRSISASWAGWAEGAALPRRNSVGLHHARLPPCRRGAFRGRYVPGHQLGREFRASDPRHRRADP